MHIVVSQWHSCISKHDECLWGKTWKLSTRSQSHAQDDGIIVISRCFGESLKITFTHVPHIYAPRDVQFVRSMNPMLLLLLLAVLPFLTAHPHPATLTSPHRIPTHDVTSPLYNRVIPGIVDPVQVNTTNTQHAVLMHRGLVSWAASCGAPSCS